VIDRQKHGVRLQLPRRCYRTGIFIFEINLMRTIKLDLKYLEDVRSDIMQCHAVLLFYITWRAPDEWFKSNRKHLN